LEKSGYDDWSETKTINAGDSHEVDPVMNKSSSTSTPTSTPKPTAKPTAKKATPKPTKKKPTPTKKTKDLLEEEMATESGEATIAGETTQSGELISPTATPSSKFRKVLGGIFLSLGGLSVLGAGVFHFLKTKGLKFNFS